MIKEHLINNKIVIMPSDTVWGIFGVISKDNQKIINKIKEAPEDKVISIMFANIDQAKNYVDERYWDKLELLRESKTFILESSNLTKELLGYDTIGVRIVPKFEELIKETGPLFTTSANVHGEETPEEYEQINKIFRDKVAYIQEGEQISNKPSEITSYLNGEEKRIR